MTWLHRTRATLFSSVQCLRNPPKRGLATGGARPFTQIPPQAPKPSRYTWKTYALGSLPLFAFGLGTWQVQRLQWKLGLIQSMEERVAAPPTLLPATQDILKSPGEWEYRRFLIRGEWCHDREILVGPRTRGDGVAGWFVLTPLRFEGTDRTILVNRGWVSMDRKDPQSRPQSHTQSQVIIQGVYRPSEKKGTFVPANDPQRGQWYRVDAEEMGQWCQTDPILLDVLDELTPTEETEWTRAGIPVGRSAHVDMRNTHLQYAITWYSLSFFTGMMMVSLLRRGRGKGGWGKMSKGAFR